MRRKQLSHRIRSLEVEKKVVFLATLGTLIACFLPWYGINSRVIPNGWWNAFGSIGAVAGYVITLFSVSIIGLMAVQLLKPEWNVQQKLPVKESSFFLFLSAQSLFVALLFIPIYNQYSVINASNSGTRFGIYVALATTLVAALASWAYQKRMEKTSPQKDFATIPRTHRAVNEWGQEEGVEDYSSEAEDVQQENMFDQPYAEQTAEYNDMEEQQNEYHQLK